MAIRRGRFHFGTIVLPDVVCFRAFEAGFEVRGKCRIVAVVVILGDEDDFA